MLERPPTDEKRKHWADWFSKLFFTVTYMQLPVKTDATRGDPGNIGRMIFNVDDGMINVDDGLNWTLPDGTIT